MEEPSILDYLKSILNPWQKEKIKIPILPAELPPLIDGAQSKPGSVVDEVDQLRVDTTSESGVVTAEPNRIPLLLLSFAVLAAVIAQRLLEPPERHLAVSIVLYVFSVLFFILFLFLTRGQTRFIVHTPEFKEVKIKKTPLILSIVFSALSFFMFGTHRFDGFNLMIWVTAIGMGIYAFWQPQTSLSAQWGKLRAWMQNPFIGFHISWWTVLLCVATLAVLFFRFYRLDEVPGEMFSDHAEKLLDVSDVLDGNFWTYFPRNTGREAVQMYLTAGVSLLFGTGLSFMSLKIGTALAGLFTLPYIYLLGKELGNKWVGLIAFLFAGVAYWGNVIARIGLRFPLYPLFTAPVLFYLIRGLRRSRWNDFILAGIALGIGLHGYSPIRFLPFVITAAVALYLLHPVSKGKRKQAIYGYLVLAFVAFLLFIPLLRYWADDPQMFAYRSLSRLSTTERSYPGPVTEIFFSNLWKSLVMFFYDNGGIWVHSVPGRPALSVIPAAFFFLSIFLLFFRYLKEKDWVHLFLLISIPLLMMPSILSLAFPDENPSLNRTGGALIPVFVMIALMVEYFLSTLVRLVKKGGKIIASICAIMIFMFTMSQDYDLIFQRFDQQFMAGAWNTSQIGKIIRAYADSTIGERDSAYVVPFPHWVDTRLVGINAGFPGKDYAIWSENFADTLSQSGAKVFIIKSEDQDSILALLNLYPQSSYWLYDDTLPGKEFWVFLVPEEPAIPASGTSG